MKECPGNLTGVMPFLTACSINVSTCGWHQTLGNCRTELSPCGNIRVVSCSVSGTEAGRKLETGFRDVVYRGEVAQPERIPFKPRWSWKPIVRRGCGIREERKQYVAGRSREQVSRLCKPKLGHERHCRTRFQIGRPRCSAGAIRKPADLRSVSAVRLAKRQHENIGRDGFTKRRGLYCPSADLLNAADFFRAMPASNDIGVVPG